MNSQTFRRLPQLLTLFLWTFFLSCPVPAVYKNGDMIWIYDILIEINKAALKSELNHLFGNGHGREVSGSVQNYSISSNYKVALSFTPMLKRRNRAARAAKRYEYDNDKCNGDCSNLGDALQNKSTAF